ncbi:hypothetical protein FKW77_005513 [Venturia effusa]|uniref:Xylanolytic transcriptional activator regulatory domain-containing protein n=1 Tax=Venturia effusa TaxID=50376 RepID=A0A517LLK4_9PEZI|nr:hypothetical protein FKW77_005513 [Venturia effusa]
MYTKCDGTVPSCATCRVVYGTECGYDTDAYEAARRKTSGSKRDSSVLTGNVEYVVSQIRLLPEDEAQNLFWLIRSESDDDKIADALRHSRQKSKQLDPVLAGADSSTISGDPSAGQTFCYGHTSQLGLAENDTEYNPQKAPLILDSRDLSITWTDVTTDVHFIRYLLHLYFTWGNKFFPLVREQDFYCNFAQANASYCSSILVNAMCSYACHFTNEPAGRTDPDNPRTAGDHFFLRAKQLLDDSSETSCFTTVQALAILSVREASAGRDSSGYKFHGRALRMALELGMHLKHGREPTADDRIREETMWSLFILETAWSVCIGRVSQLPREALAIDSPKDMHSNNTWQIINDETRYEQRSRLRCDDAQLLHCFVKLSEIVGDLITMFFAPPPRSRMTSGRVRSFYQQLRRWYNNLPASLKLLDQTPPHIYILHMYYWTCMIHLFRPLVRLELDDGLPLIHCREIAIHAAVQVVKISADYRRLFPTRTVVLFWTHTLLSSGTLFLLDLPAKSLRVEDYTDANQHAMRNVAQILEHLSAMSDNHHFATRCAGIIRGLAEERKLMLPVTEPTSLPQHIGNDAPVQSNYSRPFSVPKRAFGLTADELEPPKAKNFPLRSQSMRHPSAQSHPYAMGSAPQMPQVPSLTPAKSFQPFDSYPPDPALSQARYHPPPVPFVDPNPPILWSPDGNGLPNYNNNTTASPMSVANMMSPIPTTDALIRDGFKLSDRWGWDPFGAHYPDFVPDMMQQGPSEGQQPPFQHHKF